MTDKTRSKRNRILEWLTEGYPNHGVPEHGYVTLLGVLHRQLTQVEVHDIASAVAEQAPSGAPITEEAIRSLIEQRIHEHADADSIFRVLVHLAHGQCPWPTTDSAPNAVPQRSAPRRASLSFRHAQRAMAACVNPIARPTP